MNVQLATLPPHRGSTVAQRAGGGGYQAVIDRQSILRKGSRAGFATRNDLYTALALTVRDRGVSPRRTDSFFVLFNADYENVLLHLGGRARAPELGTHLDTSASHMESHTLEHLDSYLLKGRSLAMLRPKLPTGTET